MIKTVLWDVDNTLLDFLAAERAAIKSLFTDYGLGECSDEMISRYSKINVSFWQRLERNEITKPEVLVGRFLQFFGEYGIDTRIVPEFNSRYQLKLDDTIFEDVEGDADTLAGLLLELKGDFPKLHEKIDLNQFTFEIVELEERRIAKVKVVLHSTTTNASSSMTL